MPTFILSKLASYWLEHHGYTIKMLHVFSCEKFPPAITFIERHHTPRYIYQDITELGNDMAFDVRSSQLQPVVGCDIVIGGTEAYCLHVAHSDGADGRCVCTAKLRAPQGGLRSGLGQRGLEAGPEYTLPSPQPFVGVIGRGGCN